MPVSRVPIPPRLLGLLMYLGGAPLYPGRRAERNGEFIRHHREHALGVFTLLLGVLAVFLLVIAALSYSMIWRREWYESLALEPRLLDVTWKCLLAWVVFWAFAAIHAVVGSTRPIPVVTGLSRRAWLRRATCGASWLALALTVTALVIAVTARQSLRSDAAPGAAYMVYEDLGRVPQWVFALGFYRLASASEEVYGPGQAVYLKLTEENLRRALLEGRFLFVGSHGKALGLITEDGWFRPEDVGPGDVNPELGYVYLTGCDSGAQARAWRDALAPAEVVTHDRLTTVLEHVWWLWVEGPRALRTLGQN